MRWVWRCVLGACVAAVWAGWAMTWDPAQPAVRADDTTPRSAPKLPPLKVNRAKPLLLDGGSPATKGGLPPLKVDRAKPLRLGDEPAAKPKTGANAAPRLSIDGTPIPKADNQACFVCHSNYQEEEMARVHADNNVGCVKCHGESLAHRNDENNVTPPERMYPEGKIDAACKECHSEHNAPASKVLQTWLAKCPHKKEPAGILCTDCHGEHRLKVRTVRWDKATGRLLGADKAAKEVSPK